MSVVVYSLSWEAPKPRFHNTRLPVPDTLLAGLMLVVSWVDVLYPNRKRGRFSSQSLWFSETALLKCSLTVLS
jgi:hypothetical protein